MPKSPDQINPAQQEVKDVTDSLLATHSSARFAPVYFDVNTSPVEVEALLCASSVSDLLIQEGDVLLPNFEEGRSMHIGQAELVNARIVVWGQDFDGNSRPQRFGSPTNNWLRALGVNLDYRQGQQEASQRIGIKAYSSGHDTAILCRDILFEGCDEGDFDLDGEALRDAVNQEEVIAFTGLIKRIATAFKQ